MITLSRKGNAMVKRTVDRRVVEYDDSRERLAPEEREKWLSRKLQDVLEYAYENATAVKDKLDRAGVSPADIRTVSDMERLPVTTKDELLGLQRANPPFGGFLAVPLHSLRRIYISPGPIYDAWSPDHAIAGARHYYNEMGARPGDIALVSTAYHMVPAGLVITDQLDLLGITVVPAGTGQTELQVQIMRELGITGYCGFPTFLMTIIKKAEEMGYDLRRDFKLRWASVSGERHGLLLRRSFEEDYGLVTSQFYGTADVGLAAFECREKNGMHFHDDGVLIEICDPQTGKQLGHGEVGEIVVTRLDEVYPLIRLGTGDLASYVDEVCPCGRTSPRITKILGMVGDHIRVKSMFVHKREVEEAISKMTEVSRAQMVVTLHGHTDMITFKVELAEETVDEPAFCQSLTKRCQEVFRLRPDKIEVIPKGTLPDEYETFVDNRW